MIDIYKERFRDQVALVTGAASGMGRATAQRIAREGGKVFCVDIDEEGLQQTVSGIRLEGCAASGAAIDIANPGLAKPLIDNVLGTFGKLTVLCNIAGVGKLTPLSDETSEMWRKHFAVNVDAQFYLSQAAMPQLLAHQGSIVNVASTAGLIGQIYMASYCASKHAVIGLTKALAVEFGRSGLRVNAVCPGGTQTPFVNGFVPPENAQFDLLARLSLLADMAVPADIANTICYVASPDARYMNGAIVSVDGGTVIS